MSGHNKWANIKQRKGAQDAKRSNVFSKLAKEIILAARKGGGSLDTNATLRAVVERAKAVSMPRDNIEKNIKRGTGELEGISYEELTYEGYGPGGVALIVDIVTDNKNRSAAEIRKVFSKFGGNLGESGSVAWMFDKLGYIAIDGKKFTEDQVMEIALELGASDVKSDEDTIEVYATIEDYLTVLDGLKKKGIEVLSTEMNRFPKNTVALEKEKAMSVLRLMDELEGNDDVQTVASNADIDDSVMEEFANS